MLRWIFGEMSKQKRLQEAVMARAHLDISPRLSEGYIVGSLHGPDSSSTLSPTHHDVCT